MKFMNMLRYNPILFAADDGKGDGSDGAGEDGNDSQDDDDQEDNTSDSKDKKSDKKGKYLTQEDVDRIVEERLKRERKKQQKQETKDDKKDDKDTNDKSKENEKNAKKLSDLEMKVLCYDHDISKEYVKEAIALAKAYVDEDTDMDEALELVTKKFPQFVKGFDTKKKKTSKEEEADDEEEEDDTDNKKAWGQRQRGNKEKDLSKMSYDEYKAYRQGKKG